MSQAKDVKSATDFQAGRSAVKCRRFILSPALGLVVICILGSVIGAYSLIAPTVISNWAFFSLIAATFVYGYYNGFVEFSFALVIVTNIMARIIFELDDSNERAVYLTSAASFFTALGGFAGAFFGAIRQIDECRWKLDEDGCARKQGIVYGMAARWRRLRERQPLRKMRGDPPVARASKA